MLTFTNVPAWLALLFLFLLGIGYLIRKRYDAEIGRRYAVELKLAEHRHTLDEDFMVHFWPAEREGDSVAEEQAEFLKNWGRRMFLTASDDVILKFQAMEGSVGREDKIMLAAADLFLAIRKDMGNARTAITNKEVLRSIIRPGDWSQVDALVAGTWKPDGGEAETRATPSETGASASSGITQK